MRARLGSLKADTGVALALLSTERGAGVLVAPFDRPLIRLSASDVAEEAE